VNKSINKILDLMKNIVYISIIILFLFSCSNDNNQNEHIISDTTIIVNDTTRKETTELSKHNYIFDNDSIDTYKKINIDTINKDSNNNEINPYKNSNITFSIIPSIENTYGYEIFIDNKKVISQPSIPGILGNRGFISIEQAQKVASLAINKIKNNILPPTITTEELDSIGVMK
jgi:hypothetical protein